VKREIMLFKGIQRPAELPGGGILMGDVHSIERAAQEASIKTQETTTELLQVATKNSWMPWAVLAEQAF
jgi:hypothetical protein